MPGESRTHDRNVEAIRASGLFDAEWYKDRYPDVVLLNIDPAEHYYLLGYRLNRNPSEKFNTLAYLRDNYDVAVHGINPLLHFIMHGRREGRKVRLAADPLPLVGEATTLSDTALKSINLPAYMRKEPSSPSRWTDLHFLTEFWRLHPRPSATPRTELIYSAKELLASRPLSVSVVMPAWNRSEVVVPAIESALKQSHPATEIIFSDDGSDDYTCEIVEKAFREQIKSGTLFVVRNPHKGVSAARNAGLQRARGDLIAYLDSDNQWNPHYLLLMAALFASADELMTAYAGLKQYDRDQNKRTLRAIPYDRKKLLEANFIDLNVFMHRRTLFDRLGGFDEGLSRLVDWDLIVRYTKEHHPAFLPYIGVNYFLDSVRLKNITRRVPLDQNLASVSAKNLPERLSEGIETLRLAYFIYDYPALSQTFVLAELRWLVSNGFDVIVYYSVSPDKSAKVDFEIPSFKVSDSKELALLLREHKRNLCHTHFAFPGATKFVWPACQETGIRFTVMPHAVDIFHHENVKRNRVSEVASSPECLKVFVHGDYHRKFLEKCGVPTNKIAYTLQAIESGNVAEQKDFSSWDERKTKRGIIVGRLVEKKGVKYLIEAASKLRDCPVEFWIYGYGPLEKDLRDLASNLKVSNVQFKGVLDGAAAVSRAYAEADFLIVPSVEARNGDLDGFPTVIIEAMRAGLPVVATDVAAIPNYLRNGIEAMVVPPARSDLLAAGIRNLISMSKPKRSALVTRAKAFAESVGVEQTMTRLLDAWYSYSIDIILVTYNTPEYENREETLNILRRIQEHTTTDYTLTIVDNGSDNEFWDSVIRATRENSRIRLIRKNINLFCGPATDLALKMCKSEFVIYVCSKEGFIKEHGWERRLIQYMRDNPKVAMAGRRTHLPKYTYGRELANHPRIGDFRDAQFAVKNPDRPFVHVQGGIFIARKEALNSIGGYNPKTPQALMDVEVSYYLESKGYQLGDIPEVASITTKTLPRLVSILDERTVAAHPLTKETVHSELDVLTASNFRRCNVCGKPAKAFGERGECQHCGASAFARLIYKVLANDHRSFRGASLALLSDTSLRGLLGTKMYELDVYGDKLSIFSEKLKTSIRSIDCAVIDQTLCGGAEVLTLWRDISLKLAPDGQVLLTDEFDDQSRKLYEDLSRDQTYLVEYIDRQSFALGLDWRRLIRIVKVR